MKSIVKVVPKAIIVKNKMVIMKLSISLLKEFDMSRRGHSSEKHGRIKYNVHEIRKTEMNIFSLVFGLIRLSRDLRFELQL